VKSFTAYHGDSMDYK